MIPTNKIISYLDELIPNPKCELNYNKDYELLIAVMLSAQTTDKRVNMVTKELFTKYPNLEALKNADIEDLKTIIRPLGTYQKKASNIKDIASKLLEVNGKVPPDREFLESLSGVGRKTTNVVLGELYNYPCIAVDTHVKRVSARLGLASANDDVLEVENKLMKSLPHDNLHRLHRQLLLFGRYYCKAINPACENCKLKDICKHQKNGN